MIRKVIYGGSMNIKQDINMTRKPVELEQKYKLGDIPKTEKRVSELEDNISVDTALSSSSPRPVANKTITQALANKVNAITGKGLSTNDFTNEYKNKLDNTQPIGSVFFSVTEITDTSWQFIDTLTIGTEIIYCYKKIS